MFHLVLPGRPGEAERVRGHAEPGQGGSGGGDGDRAEDGHAVLRPPRRDQHLPQPEAQGHEAGAPTVPTGADQVLSEGMYHQSLSGLVRSLKLGLC